MFDLFVGHESIHNIFKWNRINGDGTEQNEWNGMNKIKYTRLNDNVTEYIERKRISSVSWSIFLCVCVCVLTMLTMCLWECWVKWKIFSLMWTNLKAWFPSLSIATAPQRSLVLTIRCHPKCSQILPSPQINISADDFQICLALCSGITFAVVCRAHSCGFYLLHPLHPSSNSRFHWSKNPIQLPY